MKSDLKFIDEHIKYEIKGAERYIDKAYEHKQNGDMTNAQIFYNMAMQEMNHLENLMKMHEEHCKKWDDAHAKWKDEPNVYKELWDEHYKEIKDKYEHLKDKMTKMK